MASEKLPRARLIRRRATFASTRERGRRTTNRWMTLSVLARPISPGDEPEVAFLTPKRIGGAVLRNRLRRRMREIYRRSLAPTGSPFYLVWIARPGAVELSFAELRDCMTTLRRRANLGG